MMSQVASSAVVGIDTGIVMMLGERKELYAHQQCQQKTDQT
ncbi:MAG: hypothetical protein M0Z83_03750 [Betaproteobacteria bacterium]|nr:hypothetical protein [Betaproteobacteria bacterium]